ncbi:TPA: fibronectin [Candidatus Marinimicrobia bacterium]|nr:MAG: Fibronectin type III domain-containing protein [Marinimicrobia bacterium 46_47]KUK93477.1 MAG: Fibronectin type III domain-containing protein [Marinimicrobia bacterium 46_43]HAE86659.1 fibronectin [Candidatus Neomarinimicrobiota bacterium]HBY17867.1 fibronectin [Candidatus Neomarinimicrobiota bacterium]
MKYTLKISTLLFLIVCLSGQALSQVAATDRRYVRIGSLQTHFNSYFGKRAWNNVYYEGMIWPADYLYQDNDVIQRAWIGVDDFTDAAGYEWEKWTSYITQGNVDISLFPVRLRQTAKFPSPTVYVDGNNLTAPYEGDVDAINPNQIADRIVENIVNTTAGITMTMRVHAFSQQYHDNYFIKELVFTNTGYVGYDSVRVLNETIKGLRVGWSTRYQCSREAGNAITGAITWGKHSWVSRSRFKTEDPGAMPYPVYHTNLATLTESTPIDQLEWIRCGYSFLGQVDGWAFDNVGGPYASRDGRLTAPHYVGTGVLHVDKSASDHSDDPNQPTMLGWHAGDTYPSTGDLKPADEDKMVIAYQHLSGQPYGGSGKGGGNLFYEDNVSSVTDRVDPSTIHGDGGGTNVWITYGPFDIPPGDSVKIVEVEAINGLSRPMCEQIGRRWKQAYMDPNDKGPFTLPDGSTTDDKDVFKNTWVFTGRDSFLLTMSRALRNYSSGFQIPQAPRPPEVFNVESKGDRIDLIWTPSPDEGASNFAGYRIYRAISKPDTLFDLIAEVPPGTQQYYDESPARGFSYYYYITAYSDGSLNSDGIYNPTGPLESTRFYTKTTEPAYLKRQAGENLKDIRVVPNPFNIRAEQLQYTGEDDKIMFLNIPGKCIIRIFSERGDLIETIVHDDGSGDETWKSLSSSRQVVVSGIYIAHFEVTEDQEDPFTGEILYRKGETATRKIIIVR